MNPPDPVNAFNGMSQGAEGFAQGNIGSSVGRSQGPSLGINRAATGGPNMDQSAPQTGTNSTRQTKGIFDFLTGGLLGGVTGKGAAAGLLGPALSALIPSGGGGGSSPAPNAAPVAATASPAAAAFSSSAGAANRGAMGLGSNMPGSTPASVPTPSSSSASGAPVTGAGSTDSSRATQSFLSSILPIATVAANFIPGVGPLVSAGLGVVSGIVAKNAAQQAANAALGNQSQIASELASGPNLDPLIKQEQAGITSAVENSNAANPGKLLMDSLGGAFSNAISGVASGRNSALTSAAGIYGGQGTAAQSQAAAINPFSGLSSLIPGNTPGAPGAPLLSGGAETAPGAIQGAGSEAGGGAVQAQPSGGVAAPSGGSDFSLTPADNPFASVTTQSVKPKTGAGSK
jgi:hypothetical protein